MSFSALARGRAEAPVPLPLNSAQNIPKKPLVLSYNTNTFTALWVVWRLNFLLKSLWYLHCKFHSWDNCKTRSSNSRCITRIVTWQVGFPLVLNISVILFCWSQWLYCHHPFGSTVIFFEDRLMAFPCYYFGIVFLSSVSAEIVTLTIRRNSKSTNDRWKLRKLIFCWKNWKS